MASTPVTVGAQTRLTLDEALSRAVTASARLDEARARIAQAEANVTARRTDSRPNLSAVAGILRTNHVDEFSIRQPDGSLRVLFPDLPTNYRMRAELGVPVYTAGRVDAAITAARAEADAATADLAAVRADVELETTVAYWTLVTTRARAGVLSRAVERADQLVADVGARVETGILPPNERLTAEAVRARQRVQWIQAGNEAALAQAVLARLIGAPSSERLEPVTSPAADGAGLAPERLPAADASAESQRPERQALVLRRASLREASAALGAATRPQVNVVAAAEPARPNPRFVPRTDDWHLSWDLGVSVSWSLWDGGRNRAGRAVLAAQETALAARTVEFDRMVALEVEQRRLELASLVASLGAADEGVAAATEARRVVGERFRAGVAVSADVLDSDVALLEAELDRTRIESAIRVAQARLVRARGGQR